jgi:small GTP-binding protein
MADDDMNEIKIILIGEPGTGKTCLINVSTGNQFNENSESTLLSTYVTKKMVINDKEYALNLWDTAGQEKYRAMTKIFTKNSKIVIFVYAINNKNTFEEMKSYWIKTIKETLGDEPILGIAGNKSDLYLEEAVPEEEAREFANKLGIKFKLVSAKNDPNSFVNFLQELVEEFLKTKGISAKNGINLNKQKKKKSGCC